MLAWLGLSVSLVNPAEFQNLGFDEADTSGLQVGEVAETSRLFPGWTITSGTNLIRLGLFDGISIGFPSTIGDARLITASGQTSLPVDGPYAVDLTPVLGQGITISQAGMVPADARSLRFIGTSENGAVFPPRPEFYALAIDGTPVSLRWTPLVTQGIWTWDVAADISAYAGREVNLAFATSFQTVGIPGIGPPQHDYVLDAIRFSPEVIPEPSIAWLLIVGICALGIRQLFREQRSQEGPRPTVGSPPVRLAKIEPIPLLLLKTIT